jgi:DNA adenine methylase
VILVVSKGQIELLSDIKPLLKQPKPLLKWVGSKHRDALRIAQVIPRPFNKYIEPFVGSGAVLGVLAPERGLAGDVLKPLIEIWRLVQTNPTALLEYYATLWQQYNKDPDDTYQRVLNSYNQNPNPYDLLFLCRACYGGVVRFTHAGKMSTPVGAHNPISPASLEARMNMWRERIQNTQFVHASFEETMAEAENGDIIYCDPPYVYTQRILYGAQSFQWENLWVAIEKSISVGAKVLLSLDRSKKSGRLLLDLDIPKGLFRREIILERGGSMLRRFQKKGGTMHDEIVHDRLLLTW